MAMEFPVADLMDEQACYQRLLEVIHPHGLACPQCRSKGDQLGVHRRHREPVLDYQCGECGAVFNLFTGTPLAGTPRACSHILLIPRGIAQGQSTASLARELKCSRPNLLELRHRLQANASEALFSLDPARLSDAVVEADELYQNAGEKRTKTRRSGRSATTTRQQGPRPRQLGQRPSAGAGRGRP